MRDETKPLWMQPALKHAEPFKLRGTYVKAKKRKKKPKPEYQRGYRLVILNGGLPGTKR